VEEASLEGLYRFHVRELMRFATTLVGPSNAADVVSDAMESLLKSNQLAAADNPPALLYRVVLTKARSMQRSSFRRRARELRFAQALTTANPELRPDVVEAVVKLSHRQRACIYLTYWHDLTPAQVGQWLDISEGTVKRHLARARAHLRRVIDE